MKKLFYCLLALSCLIVYCETSHAGDRVRLAPDGTYVYGTPKLAPDGTYVGGKPNLAPDGSYVGGRPRSAPDGS